MNDDYLWDKSGEPDPQIQQLEEILGTLRYQPKPLAFPRRRSYRAWLAIAATFVVAFLAGGLWLTTRKPEASIPAVAIAPQPTPISPPATPIPSVTIAEPRAPIPGPPLSLSPEPRKSAKQRLAKYDQKEALAAKQQLMFALRLTSEKLNAAHRRTQDKRSSYEDILPN